jgi:hypothetical protein
MWYICFMIEIYAKCTSCGVVGRRVRKALGLGLDIVVYKTGRPEESSERHMQYLKDNNLPLSYRTDIVVDNGKVERLEQWLLSHS